MTSNLKLDQEGTPKAGTPAILGIPFDANSSYLRGSAAAPDEIRAAFHSTSSNYWTELGVDLGVEGIFFDAGNLKFSLPDAFGGIEREVGKLLERKLRPICLGGDHSITSPIIGRFRQTISKSYDHSF